MTILELEILMHYYAYANEYRDGDFSAPAVRKAMVRHTFNSMLERVLKKLPCEDLAEKYKLTDKGRFFVEHILKTPLPKEVISFEIPVDVPKESE